MKQIRLILVGFGVVGQGFAELLMTKHEFLKQYYGVDISLLGVANARHGFVYRQDGLHIPLLLELAAKKGPLTDYPGIIHWDSALEGLQASSADILVEVTPTNLRDAEPGMSHMRVALSKGMHVVTANKGPVALAASELISLGLTKREAEVLGLLAELPELTLMIFVQIRLGAAFPIGGTAVEGAVAFREMRGR